MIKIEEFSDDKGFEGFLESLRTQESQWIDFMEEKSEDFPKFFNFSDFEFNEKQTKICEDIIDLIIVYIFKPEKSLFMIKKFIDDVMTLDFLNKNHFNLENGVKIDSDCKSPIIFSSAPGFDPSNQIYNLAKHLNISYQDVAIGSQEGYELAYKSIDKAV